MKINNSKFNKLIDQHTKTMAKREQGIAKITESYDEALQNVEIAKMDIEKAKESYDPNALVEAKIRLSASEEVVETFKEALDATSRDWVYSNQEIDHLVRESEKFAREVEESACQALGELISKMLPIIEETDKVFDDVNEYRREVTRGYTAGASGYHPIWGLGLLQNVKRDVSHYLQHYSQYIKK